MKAFIKKQVKYIFVWCVGIKLRILWYLKPAKTLEKIFNLFCTPLKGRFKEIPDFLNSTAKERIHIAGQVVQTYHWPGSNQHILLLHGWQSNSSRWQGLVEQFQKQNFSITAVDLPAHGNSTGKQLDLPIIASVVELCLKKFKPNIIIAHSLAASGMVYGNWQKQLSKDLTPILLAPPAEMIDLLENFRSILNLPDKIIDQMDSLVRKNLGVSLQNCSIPKFAEHLSQRGLLIHDKKDEVVPLAEAKRLAKFWEKCNFVISDGAGHSLNDDQSQKTILNFVNNLKKTDEHSHQ